MSPFNALPAEIIYQILLNLDPSSFYICLQTSQLFREHALASKTLLRHHLSGIPGRRRHLKNNTASLLRLFGWNASLHLFNGAERMADIYTWRASPGLDRKASKIAAIPQSEEARSDPTLKFIEVQSMKGLVNIYSIDDSGMELEHVLSPHMVSDHLPPLGGLGSSSNAEYKVLKVATQLHCDTCDGTGGQLIVAVLYAPKRHMEEPKNNAMRVISFRIDPEYGPLIERVYHVSAYLEDGFVVLDMALDVANNDPIILSHWQAQRIMDAPLPPPSYRISTYYRTYDDLTCKWTTVESRQTMLGGDNKLPISTLLVQGGNLHLCPTAIPIPHWTSMPILNSDSTEEIFERRDTYIPDVLEAFPKQSIGHVIASFHHHQITDRNLNDGAPTCVNTALELVIAREDVDSPFWMHSRRGIFLLKAIHYPDSCVPFDMTADYPSLQHVFVAHLPGLSLENLSSIGIKLAVSPRAHRIAIAHWRTLLVYALHPNAFLDPDYALTGGDGVPGDYAFIEGCGWEYYSNGEFDRECVVLPPVQLDCKGVVFGLEWRNENELWGWTEEGVVRWRVGVNISGARGCEELAAVRPGGWKHSREGKAKA